MANKHEMVPNFISCKRNASSNHDAIPQDTHQDGTNEKDGKPCDHVKPQGGR